MDTKDTGNAANDPVSTAVTLGLPRQMAISLVCRGAQSGWHQLVEATANLMQNPQFRNSFPQSFASGQGLSIGQPQQLLGALMVDPAWLIKTTPPGDVYARSTWLTARVYDAALTISVKLAAIPVMFSAVKGATPAETGAMVREVLDGQFGLAQTAARVSGLSNDLATYLSAINGDLKAAQSAYQAAGAALVAPQGNSGTASMVKSIGAHSNAMATASGINTQLNNLQAAASQVSAFAVIANMTLATQSLTTAWQATQTQFASAALHEPENLGDIVFLQNSLKLDSATGEWAAFAETTKSFLKRALIVH